MGSAEIVIRQMQPGDLDTCMALKELAGWNQERRDWEIFQALRPEGCFVAVSGHTIVGTVTTIDYAGRFSWIGMVIVHPDCRRRGVGTGLLRQSIASLASCETIKLDATPAGKMVYDRLGFVDEYGLVRLVAPAARPAVDLSPLATRVSPLTAAALDEVVAFDTPIFGADRAPVLAAWLERSPAYARVLTEDGAVRGYCMGRPGANFDTIGPVVARDAAAAQALVLSALTAATDRPVCIDVLEHTPSFSDALGSMGFSPQRPFIRMYRGSNRFPGIPQQQWAICGPEIG